ncbi:hypothetical protein CY35_15G060600 [Sphagnum magellanicum]|nr:hypothetical protein CY35_15G060600 [Sphagnum magellanicum]
MNALWLLYLELCHKWRLCKGSPCAFQRYLPHEGVEMGSFIFSCRSVCVAYKFS